MKRLSGRTDTGMIPRGAYRQRARQLRLELLEMQTRLRESPLRTVVLVCGVDGAGKGEVVNVLNAWMDPHWIQSRGFDTPSDEELERPRFWRFWRALPARGEMAFFLSAWYSEPLLERVGGRGRRWLQRRLDQIRSFEQMLAVEDHLILKFWLHLDKDAQEQRLRALESDPLQSWRVTETDWQNWSRYDRFVKATEEILEATHTESCPWIVVDSSDSRRRDLAVAEGVLDRIQGRLRGDAESPPADLETNIPESGTALVVELEEDEVSELGQEQYRRERTRLQGELNQLHRRAREAGQPMVSVFEGRDAAGKGGAIRRLVPAFDAHALEVVRVGPPTEEELAHHYLWRFWRRLPRAGNVTIFDRSWYGRVLVERVDGLIGESAWRRAYDEINDFELQMVEHGTALLKCWLNVSREEQARRFEERKRVPHKRWKLTEDDLHSRGLWDDYDAAVRDMLEYTSTTHAPWIVIPADDKRRARVTVLGAACRVLSERLESVESNTEGPLSHQAKRASKGE